MAKKRGTKGNGSVYLPKGRRIYVMAYVNAEGKRIVESSHSEKKGEALRLLRRRVGATEHNLPTVKDAERYTFEQGAKAMLEDFENNGKKSKMVVERRIRLHLQPFFANRRLVGISPSDVREYVAKRKKDSIVVRKMRVEVLADGTKQAVEEIRKPVSNGEINRELQILKRILSLAVEEGKIPSRPKITMLKENNVRQGFFEAHEYESVLAHLPEELRGVIAFAYITGWRIASEVLKLEWRQVDFDAGEVRLEAGTTKNGQPRVFYLSNALRAVLEKQQAMHRKAAKKGQLTPLVFFRMVADERGGAKKPTAIKSLTKAWKLACRTAGCPGRIPHDLRRTAVRNMVRAGIPESVAMQMTGHKTRSVFERYNITSSNDLKDAARRLDAAEVGTTRRVSTP
jgi:integrase